MLNGETDGGPLAGIAVSARATDRTFTTTVFTDERGRFVFPALDDGDYRLWAQGVGFETARAEATLAAERPAAHTFHLRVPSTTSRRSSRVRSGSTRCPRTRSRTGG